MVQYEKVNGHWQVISSTKENENVDRELEANALNQIENKLSVNKLQDYVKQNAPTDFLLKLYIPRYYKNGDKISPDVIANILAQIAEITGGISTTAGKGYMVKNNIMHEDKDIYVEVLLMRTTPERASALSRHIGSVIANILQQEKALVLILPAMADYINSEDFKQNIDESEEALNELNKSEDGMAIDNADDDNK